MCIARDSSGRVIGFGLTLRLRPTKTDMAGKSGAVRTFVLDDEPHALSAAAAIRQMLAHDPSAGAVEKIPLFRDVETGKELIDTQQGSSLVQAQGYRRSL